MLKRELNKAKNIATRKLPNKLCYRFKVNDSLKAMNPVLPLVDLLNKREMSYQKIQDAIVFVNFNTK